MIISQIRVGLPQEIDTASGTIITAIMKSEVSGPVMVTDKGLEGDGWGSPNVHGTPQQIICAYPQENYAYWKDLIAMDFGSFGENILLTDCDEHTVRIGDICEIGEVVLELTYPRKPCATLNKVWNNNEIVKLMSKTGKTGWYYKVLRTGAIEKGMPVKHITQDLSQPTVFEAWMSNIEK